MKSFPILLKTHSEFKNSPKDLSISIEPRRFYYIQRGILTESMGNAIPGVFGSYNQSMNINRNNKNGHNNGYSNNIQAYTLSPWVSNIDIITGKAMSSNSVSNSDGSSTRTSTTTMKPRYDS